MTQTYTGKKFALNGIKCNADYALVPRTPSGSTGWVVDD